MRGAFVVQIWSASSGEGGQIEGLIEEVDSGDQAQFRSQDELIGFLRRRFAESWRKKDSSR
jgi:hypothetical protein